MGTSHWVLDQNHFLFFYFFNLPLLNTQNQPILTRSSGKMLLSQVSECAQMQTLSPQPSSANQQYSNSTHEALSATLSQRLISSTSTHEAFSATLYQRLTSNTVVAHTRLSLPPYT